MKTFKDFVSTENDHLNEANIGPADRIASVSSLQHKQNKLEFAASVAGLNQKAISALDKLQGVLVSMAGSVESPSQLDAAYKDAKKMVDSLTKNDVPVQIAQNAKMLLDTIYKERSKQLS